MSSRRTKDDLANVVKFCGENEIKFFILGRGSNLLVRDGGFRGVVICLSQPHFSEIEIVGEKIFCGAGAKLKNVSVEAKRNNLSGVEFLEGIPGSVGGALRMNAGAMGGATFDVVESVRVMDFDGNISEMSPKEMSVDLSQLRDVEESHRAGRGFQMPDFAARGDRAAHEGVQREALGIAAGGAERGLHFQKSRLDSGGPAGGRTGIERRARGRRVGFRRAWQFHRERRQGDGARRFGIDFNFESQGQGRTRN